MSHPGLAPIADARPTRGRQQWLYKVGGTAALIAVVLFRRNPGAVAPGQRM